MKIHERNLIPQRSVLYLNYLDSNLRSKCCLGIARSKDNQAEVTVLRPGYRCCPCHYQHIGAELEGSYNTQIKKSKFTRVIKEKEWEHGFESRPEILP
jgi:hypothetical protein